MVKIIIDLGNFCCFIRLYVCIELQHKMYFFFLSFFCCTTCLAGFCFPDQESNLCSLQWKHGALTTVLPGNSLVWTFKIHVLLFSQAKFLKVGLPGKGFFFVFLKIYLFLAALGLRCCTRASSSWGERGLLFIAVHGLLTAVASRCGAQALGAQASVVVARGLSSCGVQAVERRLSSCGARAQLLCGMWDLPGPGLEPVSPALAGGFLTIEPPGEPRVLLFKFEYTQGALYIGCYFKVSATEYQCPIPCILFSFSFFF